MDEQASSYSDSGFWHRCDDLAGITGDAGDPVMCTKPFSDAYDWRGLLGQEHTIRCSKKTPAFTLNSLYIALYMHDGE